MNSLTEFCTKKLDRIFQIGARIRRAKITSEIIKQHGFSVISGPFSGMALISDVSWGDGDLIPKLLGCYESELHPSIAKAISRRPSAVVNVGCAEGYYAVGMALALPHAWIAAFDTDRKAQVICRRAAEINQVADRVIVNGACEFDILRRIISG